MASKNSKMVKEIIEDGDYECVECGITNPLCILNADQFDTSKNFTCAMCLHLEEKRCHSCPGLQECYEYFQEEVDEYDISNDAYLIVLRDFTKKLYTKAFTSANRPKDMKEFKNWVLNSIENIAEFTQDIELMTDDDESGGNENVDATKEI